MAMELLVLVGGSETSFGLNRFSLLTLAILLHDTSEIDVGGVCKLAWTR